MAPRRLARQREDWNDLARLDPLWAVLTDPERRYGRWGHDEFFATGRREVEQVLAVAARRGLTHGSGRALDFGCGVGRITAALADRFDRVDGVDIAPEMIRIARKLNAHRENCTFLLSDAPSLPAFAAGTFDFVYSTITLQHMASRSLVRSYVAGLISVLASDGLLVFQMPVALSLRHALQPKRRAYALLRRLGVRAHVLYHWGRLNPMRTISVSEPAMRQAVVEGGGAVVYVEPLPGTTPSARYYVRRA